ncbi:MAG: PAS domain S-box protein [Syntrophobacteria bacterium]
MELDKVYKAVVENVSAQVYVRDLDMNILYINPASERLTGWSLQEAMGKKCYEVFGDENLTCKEVCPADEAVSWRFHILHHEGKLKTRSGDMRDMQVSISPLHDGDDVIGAVVLMQDITRLKEVEQTKVKTPITLEKEIEERKRAGELLRESEQRYSSLFKINHSVMLVIDPENADIVDANPAACSFYGWSQKELTSMKITDINMLSNEQVFTEMEKAKSEKRQHFFFRHRLANEKIRDVEVYSGPLRLHGKKLLYSIIHDITERRRAEEELQKSEERYRLLVETMNEGLAMADQNYVFTYVNERFCEMIGCSRDELIGHNLIEFVHDDYKESMKDQMGRRKMGEAKRFDLVWRAKDGHKIYTLVSPRGFFDAEGRFTGSLGVLTDITDRKQAEKALRKAHDRLERRTTDLVKLNRKMKQEIEERKLAAQELRKREAQLEINTNELEEVNTALRVLLKRRDEDKTDLEEKILFNVKELVVPYLEKLKKGKLDARHTAYVGILESNLNDIISPFAHKMSSKYLGLTPTEIQIANLVKQGRTTKEIAEILNSSDRTVEFHRKNIRKKIGIVNRKVNLRSHLLSM